MNKTLLFIAAALSLSGCADDIPYRSRGFEPATDCKETYERYADGQKLEAADADAPCWRRSVEERDRYDLLFAEFDDQGWVQGASKLPRPGNDFLDAFFAKLDQLYEKNSNGLSLVVFVHGWHHNAKAGDDNVRSFRKLLGDVALAEAKGAGRRVVGVYVGWRGESITASWINVATFWERKNTAERVAQGSVRELFAKLDVFRDRANGGNKTDNPSGRVRLLTIGHSFGGLITYESLSSDFLRAAVRHDGKRGYLSRTGDLVVIANPAFEGTRYEPLKIAGQRLTQLHPDQLPLVIIATTQADWATGSTFPIARSVGTFWEKTPGEEAAANTRAVGHNDRYTTHRLTTCKDDDQECRKACEDAEVLPKKNINIQDRRESIDREKRRMSSLVPRGFATKEYLCGRLVLTPTAQWQPIGNPFWVVETTKEIMDGHNDIFNENFQAFIRQMYLAVIVATDRPAPVTK